MKKATGQRWGNTLPDLIVNQMIKGIAGKYKMLDVPFAEREKFRAIYQPIIDEMIPHLPKGGSSAVGAVLCKCAVKFGTEKPIFFADALRSGIFNGHESIKLIWSFLMRSPGRETLKIYQYVTTAARAFCEERPLKELRPAKKDIFEWDENWQPILSKSGLIHTTAKLA